MEPFTPSNIMFVIGLLGVLFSIYNYFRKPQDDLDKKQSLLDQEVDNRALVLAQQLQWEKDSNERRFKEVNEAQTTITAYAQNHIHGVDVKIDALTNAVAIMGVDLGNRMTKLETIVEERLPKK